MKKILILVILSLSYIFLNAQNAERKKEMERIKNSGEYYYGESLLCNTDEKAKNGAMMKLYDNIAENAHMSLLDIAFDNREVYINKIFLSLGVNDIRKILPLVSNMRDDEYSYFAYIHKNDFDSICDARVAEMQFYADKAYEKEMDENMVDALRSYYWAMMLCVAHPQNALLNLNVEDRLEPAFVYLREHVSEVLESFDFAVAKDNAGEYNDEGISVILNVRAFGSDVSGLRIEYYNGVDDYNEEMVKNGKASLQLASKDIEEIDIKIKYDFLHDLIAYPEIAKVINNVDRIILKDNVTRTISLKKYIPYINKADEQKLGKSMNDVVKLNDNERCLYDMMQKIEAAFRTKDYLSVKKYFTDEAYSMLDTIINNGKVSVVGNQEYEFITLGNTTICRDIDMKFEYKNHASFIHEMVFRFDNDKKLITSIAFRLTTDAENDIMNKGDWPKDCRYALLSFMEDYQSAYDLKRYDYLESIFSDDALIIVGHVVKRIEEDQLKDKVEINRPKEEVELLRMNKSQYFDRLSKVFHTQEYININFRETDFVRQMSSFSENGSNGEDIYGVRLLQEYNSTTYGDKGYLFLMVDLRDQKRPVIHVRAWQPDKTDINQLVGLRDLE